jgi:tetratricopeptide (TPR) repeat protein
MDRMELAKAELLKTIQCDPQFAEAYYNLANLSLGDPSAESYLLKYIQLQPEDPDGFNLLGYIYHSSGQYAKARQAYQSSLTIDPDSYYTHNSLSYVYRKMENYSAAKGLWEKYLTRKPDDPNAYFKYAGILALNKEPTEALTALRTALTKGFKAYDELQAEPNLDSLKQLAEYQALLREFFPKRE